MAVVYPLDDLLTGVKFAEQELDLMWRQEISTTGAGAIRAADVGDPVWMGRFQTVPLRREAARALKSRLDLLAGSLNTFLAWEQPGLPRDHLDGAFGDAGRIDAINDDRVRIRLRNLDPGFSISRGDLFCFDYQAGGLKRALHRAGETAVADASGETDLFTVSPPLKPAAQAGARVVFKQPSAVMVLRPGSFAGPQGDGKRTMTLRSEGVQVA